MEVALATASEKQMWTDKYLIEYIRRSGFMAFMGRSSNSIIQARYELNEESGKTINIPGINQQVFLFAEAGPAVNLNNPDRLLAQAFTGAVWKHGIGKGFTLYIEGGIGKVTDWSSPVATFGVKVSKAF